jgi:putative DNA primase/helicase
MGLVFYQPIVLITSLVMDQLTNQLLTMHMFKLVMAGNHRPVIRNPDNAMRRRLHLLPMTYKPPAPDRELQAALLAEAPGILAWAIEGCLAWQREGLGACEAMTKATAEYFAEQDLTAQWLAVKVQKSQAA